MQRTDVAHMAIHHDDPEKIKARLKMIHEHFVLCIGSRFKAKLYAEKRMIHRAAVGFTGHRPPRATPATLVNG